MRRNGLGWWRLAKQVLLAVGEPAPTPSLANSTFTAANATGTADGSTTNTLTLTARNSDNALLTGTAVTFTTELTAVDADASTLTDDAAEIEDTTGVLNLVLTLKNADGVGLPNIQSSRIVFASTGTGNTFGTPTVTNASGVSLCTFSSTVAEAKTISVTVDGVAITQTAAVTVTGDPPAPSGDLLFASDWSTGGTGTTTTALGDSGLWDGLTPGPASGDQIEVIAATGLDFPSGMSNVLAIRYEGATARGVRTNTSTPLWSVPSIGNSLAFRFYMRNGLNGNGLGGGSESTTQHPVGNRPALNPGAWIFSYDFTRFWLAITGQFIGGFADYYRIGVASALSNNATYRFEWKYTRVDTNEFRVSIRIYNSAGTLILEDADFTGQEGFAPTSGTLADAPPIYISTSNIASLSAFEISHQGLYNNTDDSNNRIYYGGVAVGADWCGAYVAGESPV